MKLIKYFLLLSALVTTVLENILIFTLYDNFLTRDYVRTGPNKYVLKEKIGIASCNKDTNYEEVFIFSTIGYVIIGISLSIIIIMDYIILLIKLGLIKRNERGINISLLKIKLLVFMLSLYIFLIPLLLFNYEECITPYTPLQIDLTIDIWWGICITIYSILFLACACDIFIIDYLFKLLLIGLLILSIYIKIYTTNIVQQTIDTIYLIFNILNIII
jgi:hypothetical protein